MCSISIYYIGFYINRPKKRIYIILYIFQKRHFYIFFICKKKFLKLCILYTEFCVKYKIRVDKKIYIKLILQKTGSSLSSTFSEHDHYSFIRGFI